MRTAKTKKVPLHHQPWFAALRNTFFLAASLHLIVAAFLTIRWQVKSALNPFNFLGLGSLSPFHALSEHWQGIVIGWGLLIVVFLSVFSYSYVIKHRQRLQRQYRRWLAAFKHRARQIQAFATQEIE